MVRTIYICPQCETVYSESSSGHDHIGCRVALITAPWTALEVIDAAPVRELLEGANLLDDPNSYYGYLVSVGVIDTLRREIAQVPEEEPLTERPEEHSPEVVTNNRARGPHPRVSHGWCTCGWRGPERDSTHAAADDISAHLDAVLPDDAEGNIHR